MRRFCMDMLLFLLPFGVLLLWYVIADPFMVVRRYKDYSPDDTHRFCANDAFRGIRLMDLYADSIKYNSFIVGSSRSDFYYADDWKVYLSDNSRCFHFNQSGDNLLGASQRLNYLYDRFDQVDNILLIMDHEFLSGITPNEGPLFVAPYQVTEQKDFFSFHWSFLRTFYSLEFQRQYWSNTGNMLSCGGEYIPTINELHKPDAERLIVNNPNDYYASLPDGYKLYPRDTVQKTGIAVIQKEQKELLQQIQQLFASHNTDYRIIISPLYDQEKLNPQDSLYLSSLFSPEKFFDFSGINAFTSDTLNYYENSHYRPSLCKELLSIVYR